MNKENCALKLVDEIIQVVNKLPSVRWQRLQDVPHTFSKISTKFCTKQKLIKPGRSLRLENSIVTSVAVLLGSELKHNDI